jgi:hypothetical protein
MVPVLVAKELPREPHNTPLHLLSNSPELISYAQRVYWRRSGVNKLRIAEP